LYTHNSNPDKSTLNTLQGDQLVALRSKSKVINTRRHDCSLTVQMISVFGFEDI